ncbi:Cupredoxin superfamily protein isoform 3 [Hibiscus syriacus]|uniref:Cupredoxin superfamily protein isoform 3 n=1 Tax=Hibiscus syriacus TaxID=106335 RepID=A0A6A2YYP6_HIBSY|nr:Cupredoxin superfamily protein isoform 3 [Hibiscus syriacus]
MFSNWYAWHPSRPGFFYFAFNNGSLKTCQASHKLSIKASPALPPGKTATTPSPEFPPESAPAPTSGGPVVSSSPAYPWPFRPRQRQVLARRNPAVPMPTGEVDSATIRPLPTSDHGEQVAMQARCPYRSPCTLVFAMHGPCTGHVGAGAVHGPCTWGVGRHGGIGLKLGRDARAWSMHSSRSHMPRAWPMHSKDRRAWRPIKTPGVHDDLWWFVWMLPHRGEGIPCGTSSGGTPHDCILYGISSTAVKR